MLVSQAQDLMLLHGTEDNIKYLKMLFKDGHGGDYNNDSELLDYIMYVHGHTDDWLNSFPVSLKSTTALSKPKTALLKMLTIPSVMKDLGSQTCYEVADQIADSYRRLSKSISQKRMIGSVSKRSKSTSDKPLSIQACLSTSTSNNPFAYDSTICDQTSNNESHSATHANSFDHQEDTLITHCQSDESSRHPTKHSSTSKLPPTKPRLLGGKFAALVRVVRDLSIMLDEALNEA